MPTSTTYGVRLVVSFEYNTGQQWILASLSNDIDSWFCDRDNIYDELQVIYLRCDWDSCKRYLWPREIWVVSSNALWGENDQWGFNTLVLCGWAFFALEKMVIIVWFFLAILCFF